MEKTNLINDLYCGRLDPSHYSPAKKPAYRRYSDDVFVLLNVIGNTLGKESEQKLESAIIALEDIVAQDYFVLGFQWGARMMLAILDDTPSDVGVLQAPSKD